MTERVEARIGNESLSRFPAENPNPVLRILRDGRIAYANDGSAPLLAQWKVRVGEHVPEDWKEHVVEALDTGATQVIEAPYNGRVFSFTIVPLLDKDYANLYGLDITDLKITQQALRGLHEVDRAILSARSVEEIARKTLQYTPQLFDCQFSSIALVDREEQKMTLLAVHHGAEAKIIENGQIAIDEIWAEALDAMSQDGIYFTEDVQGMPASSEWWRMLQLDGVDTLVALPLVIEGALIGSLNLGFNDLIELTPNQVEIAHDLVAQAAVGIRQARLIEQTQKDAETKALLLREVNHRILNNLTMILGILGMEKRRPLDGEAEFKAAIDDVSSRVRGMVVVHRMLSNERWIPLALGTMVGKVIDAALNGSPIRDRIEVTVDAPDEPVRLTAQEAVAVALAINELTINSVKYAFRDRSHGRIYVRIARSYLEGRESVRIVFRDNGPGLPDDVQIEERRRSGLLLAEKYVTHTLGGNVDFYNESGAVASITFKRGGDWLTFE